MPRLIPRITQPSLAIKLKKDLIVERGFWLLIFDDESILSMSDSEVRAAFKFAPTEQPGLPAQPGLAAQPGPAPALHRRSVGVRPKSLTCELYGKTIRMGAQGVRILCALVSAEAAYGSNKSYTSLQLKSFLNPIDSEQIAGRLTELTTLGFAERHKHSGQGFLWSITNNGREIVKLLGTEAQKWATRDDSLSPG